MTDNEKIVLAVVAGIAIGATIGVLMAPEKGSVSRKKLLGFINEFSGLFKDKVDKGVDTLVNLTEDAFARSEKEVPEATTV